MLGLLLSGCISPEEREARRADAFDVSGLYTASTRLGSEVDMNFRIINEAGRHDIRIEVEKPRLTDAERAFLLPKNLDPGRVFELFTKKFELGRGKTNEYSGENASDDQGRSSRLYVCTTPRQYSRETTLKYCFSGVLQREARELTGHLILMWEESRPGGRTGGEVRYSLDELRMAFRSEIRIAASHSQYFGSWSGRAYDLHPELDLSGGMLQLTIKPDESSNAFSLEFRPGAKIVFRGKEFLYQYSHRGTSIFDGRELSQGQVEELYDATYPAVQFAFRSSDGQYLIFLGHIYSLGNLSGSLVLWAGRDTSQLAVLRYSKN